METSENRSDSSNKETPKLTRRGFLRVGVMGVLGALGASSVASAHDNPAPVRVREDVKTKAKELDFGPDIVFTGESYVYGGESKDLIDSLKRDFGVKVMCPTEWEGKPNRVWDLESIKIVDQAIRDLPQEYLSSSRSPKEMLLCRQPGSTNDMAGGDYNSRRVILATSDNFEPDKPLSQPYQFIFGTQKDVLVATLTHEYTHSFTEANPKLLEKWINATGWEKDEDENWTNPYKNELIPAYGANMNPVEDIAVSTSLIKCHPGMLLERRKNFFKEEQPYSSWKTATENLNK